MRLKTVSLRTNLFIVPIVALMFLSSCVSQRQTKYLQDKVATLDRMNSSDLYVSARVKPLDELFIKVVSSDKTLSSGEGTQLASTFQTSTLFLYSYPVNKDGNINYPVLGKVFVKGLTLEEVERLLEDKLQDYLSDPSVSVKFVNNYITLLGEVKKPGRYDYTKEKINIFEALGLGGDLTDYGNGQRIAVIRNVDSIAKINYIDITNKNVINSELYNLKPNDVVYVEPMKAKMWGFTQFPFAIALSLISTTILTLNYFKK